MKKLLSILIIGIAIPVLSYAQCDTIIVDFTSTAPECVGDSVDFLNTGTSSPVLTYTWDFGAGATPATSTDENPTGIVYSTWGLKSVALNVTGTADLCDITEIKGININEEPTASFSSTAPACMGESVDFTNTGSTGPWTFEWNFGADAAPANSSAENPASVVYSSYGSKIITFTIKDGNCTDTYLDTITILETPVADFTSTAPSCTGDSVDFANIGTTGATSYNWDFGLDAIPATSTDENPANVVYSTDGIKTVTLITTIGACSDTSIKTINIAETPAPNFTHNAPQCEGADVNFIYTGTTGVGWTYDWDFGEGALPSGSTAENPVGIIYTGSGTKTVTLTVTNGICSETTTQVITINQTPKADFSSTAPSCTGDSVDFANTGTIGATSYNWDFGLDATPATSTDENPANIIYSTEGIKTVTLITTLATCSDTSIQTINITETPAPNFTHNAPQCEGADVNFNYTGTTGIGWTFEWDFGNGATPNTSTAKDSIEVVYSGQGTKTITLTVTNGLCSETTTQNITINQTPIAVFTSTAPSCTGDSVDFANTGTTSASYSWDFGSGATPATSTDENPLNVIYSTEGIKTVTLITTLATCSDTSIQTINITETPAPNFTHNAPQCEGAEVNFNYTGNTGIGWTFEWDFGNGANPNTSFAKDSIEVVYSGQGTKTITLTVTNGLCSETTTQIITINQTPVADFSSTAPACTQDTVYFINTGTSGATYVWSFDLEGSSATPATSTDENPAGIVYSTEGTKKVRLIATIGTCVDTIIKTININEKPTANFSFTTPPLCGNVGVNFANTGSSGTNWIYNWDFGEGANPSASTAENPTGITYNTSGDKTVTFTISDANCSDMVTQNLTISPTPIADFSSTAPTCMYDSVDFVNTGTTGGSWNYLWDFGSGAAPATSTDENPADIIYSTYGIKTITLIITDGTCSDTSIQTINIHQRPSVSFISSAPVCAGEGVNFANSGTTGSNWAYEWDFGEEAFPPSSTAENPGGIVYNTGGTKTITFTISDGNCTETFTNTIYIDTLPDVDAGIDTIICANRSVQIGSTPISGYTYSWYPTVTLDYPLIANPVASPDANITVYYVTVTDTGTGCQNIDSVIVTMLLPLFADAGEDVEVCFGDSIQIGSALVEGQTYSWMPTTRLSDPASPNPMAKPDTTTTYTVTVYGADCDPITDEVVVLINPLPDAYAGEDVTIARGSSTQLLATGGLEYYWAPEQGLSNISICNPIASPDTTTTYTVEVTNVYNCINYDTVTVTIVEPDFWTPTAFTPNDDDRNDIFYVRGEESGILNFEFKIFDKWGKLLFYTQDINTGWDGKNILSGEKLPSGAYVYNVKGVKSTGEKLNITGIVNLIR